MTKRKRAAPLNRPGPELFEYLMCQLEEDLSEALSTDPDDPVAAFFDELQGKNYRPMFHLRMKVKEPDDE